MTSSLRGQLLAWVLLPLGLAVAISAAIGWREADRTATVFQDRLLLGSARMIAEQVRFEDNEFQHPIPPAALGLFQSSVGDRVFYRVTTESGKLLTGTSELPLPERQTPDALPAFFPAQVRGQSVNVAAVRQTVIGAPDDAAVIVEVAQTKNGHDALRLSLWRRSVGEQVVILLLTAFLVLFGLRHGLKPVMRLRDAVLARAPGTLEPLTADRVPEELTPLLDAINEYVRQLQSYTHAQKAFIEDAAHQLRTPLTLLSTQVSFASRTDDPRARAESLAAIRKSLQKAARIVNQLLTLSSAQNPVNDRYGFRAVALDGLVQQAIEDQAAQAQSKEIDLGFETDGSRPQVDAQPMMLHEIVSNLLDNAIRYTPAGGVVTAKVASAPGVVELSVEDNGPGIPASDRERVFERFVRLDDGDSSGSGLGLAIVRALAQRNGASVSLDSGEGGRGLRASILFSRPGSNVARSLSA